MLKRQVLVLCAVAAFCIAATSAFAQTCKLTSINVSGTVSTSANGVNSSDTVVGAYTSGPPYYLHGFVWSKGTITKYNYPGAIATEFRSINDHGAIIGTAYASGGIGQGIVRANGSTIAFRFPNSYSTAAMGINNYGVIVGSYRRTATGRSYGFVKTSSGYATLNFPNSSSTWANSISDMNVIVGRYNDAGGLGHGFTYKAGVYTRVDYPSASAATSVNGVNKYGSLVGSDQLAKDQPVQAWQRKGGVFSSFTLNGASSVTLNGINNLGDEVGAAAVSGTRPGFLRICR